MRQKALLIGNDINNETENYSWDDLIDDLILKFANHHDINKKHKPFPLLFEEIYLSAESNQKLKDNELKKNIAANTLHMKPNSLHEEILKLGIENILTTNYDLTFEKAAGAEIQKLKNNGVIKESLYSLFRFHKTDHHNIWHIHGSENTSKSITLGYEHYGGYLQQMRSYLSTGTKNTYKKKEYKPIAKRLKEGKLDYESWTDFFFTHDIYIFGLKLDFVEMHLWWLLTYRARAIKEGRINCANKIYYFFPETDKAKSIHRLQMFKVCGIETIPEIQEKGNKEAYYMRIISRIKNEL